MARVTGLTVSRRLEDKAMEIHVHGDMLPCHIHREIIELIKENEGLRVCFVVENPSMLLQIRESVPFDYYHSLDIRRAARVACATGGFREGE